tara:strand:+ start:381 stop:584 length:204 start_codon:yes stop_codon:yes gene_type:complete
VYNIYVEIHKEIKMDKLLEQLQTRYNELESKLDLPLKKDESLIITTQLNEIDKTKSMIYKIKGEEYE